MQPLFRHFATVLVCAAVPAAGVTPASAQHASFRIKGRALSERGDRIADAEVPVGRDPRSRDDQSQVTGSRSNRV